MPKTAAVFKMPSPRQAAAVEFLYLDQAAVLEAGVLDMNRAMAVVGEALMLLEQGECRQPHKVVLRYGESAEAEARGRINGLCAYIGGNMHAMGMKWIASFPANRERGLPRASALLILNSADTGVPIALMDGTLISAMRTGAMTGLGARCLAPRPARKAGVIGAGVQSRTQILGLATALPELQEIAVVNRSREHSERVAQDCRERWNLPVRAADTIDEVLSDADVALTVTTASEPLMFARQIKPGALTIQLSGHECEYELILQCQKIVCDSWEAVCHRGIMTPALMHQAGLLPDERIHANLGEILLERKPGRENETERIHFCHMGMGIDDVALANSVYLTARERGIGQLLPLWDEPLWA
jgi:2,3-diaminopropionate biosynthesis protein SbnB